MVMRDEFSSRFPHCALAEQDHARQTGLLDRAYKPFRVRVQIREENRVLREQLGQKRLRFNDDQRRRLAAKAKGLGRKLLREVATIVTPETLLVWHRRLIAQKYDGSGKRGRGRPEKIRRDRRPGSAPGRRKPQLGVSPNPERAQ